ncbi:MAG: hypothetical protein KDK53_01485 [Maritimibacter sp.]|nr:hypothetical protein [Maritimibacter sp.]
MSATYTILLGTALGLAAGAMALAQDAATPSLSNNAPPLATEASVLGIGMPADADIITPLPEGAALVAAVDDILGARVYDANSEWVGEVSAFLPAPAAPDPRVVIDIGGFLGFGQTPVAVDAEGVSVAWTKDGAVAFATVDLTEADLEMMARAQG